MDLCSSRVHGLWVIVATVKLVNAACALDNGCSSVTIVQEVLL